MTLTTCRRCGAPILEPDESPRDDFFGRGRLCVHCAGEEPDARRRFIDHLDRLVPTGPGPARDAPEPWSGPQEASRGQRAGEGR